MKSGSNSCRQERAVFLRFVERRSKFDKVIGSPASHAYACRHDTQNARATAHFHHSKRSQDDVCDGKDLTRVHVLLPCFREGSSPSLYPSRCPAAWLPGSSRHRCGCVVEYLLSSPSPTQPTKSQEHQYAVGHPSRKAHLLCWALRGNGPVIRLTFSPHCLVHDPVAELHGQCCIHSHLQTDCHSLLQQNHHVKTFSATVGRHRCGSSLLGWESPLGSPKERCSVVADSRFHSFFKASTVPLVKSNCMSQVAISSGRTKPGTRSIARCGSQLVDTQRRSSSHSDATGYVHSFSATTTFPRLNWKF